MHRVTTTQNPLMSGSGTPLVPERWARRRVYPSYAESSFVSKPDLFQPMPKQVPVCRVMSLDSIKNQTVWIDCCLDLTGHTLEMYSDTLPDSRPILTFDLRECFLFPAVDGLPNTQCDFASYHKVGVLSRYHKMVDMDTSVFYFDMGDASTARNFLLAFSVNKEWALRFSAFNYPSGTCLVSARKRDDSFFIRVRYSNTDFVPSEVLRTTVQIVNGELEKQGGQKLDGRFQKRFVKIEGHALSYYSDEGFSDKKGSIDMTDAAIFFVANERDKRASGVAKLMRASEGTSLLRRAHKKDTRITESANALRRGRSGTGGGDSSPECSWVGICQGSDRLFVFRERNEELLERWLLTFSECMSQDAERERKVQMYISGREEVYKAKPTELRYEYRSLASDAFPVLSRTGARPEVEEKKPVTSLRPVLKSPRKMAPLPAKPPSKPPRKLAKPPKPPRKLAPTPPPKKLPVPRVVQDDEEDYSEDDPLAGRDLSLPVAGDDSDSSEDLNELIAAGRKKLAEKEKNRPQESAFSRLRSATTTLKSIRNIREAKEKARVQVQSFDEDTSESDSEQHYVDEGEAADASEDPFDAVPDPVPREEDKWSESEDPFAEEEEEEKAKPEPKPEPEFSSSSEAEPEPEIEPEPEVKAEALFSSSSEEPEEKVKPKPEPMFSSSSSEEPEPVLEPVPELQAAMCSPEALETSNARVAELEARVAELEAEREDSRARFTELESELAHEREEMGHTHDVLEQFKLKVIRQKEKIKKLTSGARALRAQLTDERDAWEEEREDLEARIQSASAAAAKEAGNDEEKSALEEEVVALKETKRMLLAEKREAAKKLAAYEETNATLLEDIESLKEEAAQAADLQEALDDVLQLGDPLEMLDTIEDLRMQVAVLEQELGI